MASTTQTVTSSTSNLLPGQRIGMIGAELVVKATICAATIALIAGMVVVLFG